MAYILRAIKAETIKCKRTLALGLSFLAPILVGLFYFIIYCQPNVPVLKTGEQPWLILTQSILSFWGILVVPLFITLQTGLLGNLDHTNRGYTHLYSLPIPRSAVYLAKQVTSLALIGLSNISLWIVIIVAGLGLKILRPELGFSVSIPWQIILKYVMISYLASWAIITIHTWVGIRFSSFVFAMSFGVVALMISVVVIESNYIAYFPWTWPVLATNGLLKGAAALHTLLVSFGSALLFTIFGCWNCVRRDVL